MRVVQEVGGPGGVAVAAEVGGDHQPAAVGEGVQGDCVAPSGAAARRRAYSVVVASAGLRSHSGTGARQSAFSPLNHPSRGFSQGLPL